MNTKEDFSLEHIKIEFENQKTQYNILYIALYHAIKSCILETKLPHSWPLPSTRYLCQHLKLSRTTILKSYELLQLEKLIISKLGSGYYVNFEPKKHISKDTKQQNLSKVNYPEISENGKLYLKNISLINRLPDKDIAFRQGLPPLDVFPVNQWKKLLNTYWRHIKSSNLSYSQTTGLEEFKKSVSNYLYVSRNVKCDPSQLIITSGSLQSLYLISNTLIEKGDKIAVENPLFPNVHSVCRSSQANLIPTPINSEGIDLDKLNSNDLKGLKLIHVTPSNQYPLGNKMSLKRRQDLIKLASYHGSLIIEDDYENEIANYQSSIPTLFSLDNEDRIIYMGTFNRLLHPSIRLGYMIVPKYLIPAVQALQEHSHRFVSPSLQMVMNQFIERNYLYKHIQRCMEVAKERHDLFKKLFKAHVKTMYIQEKPFCSFHLLGYFKEDKSVNDELNIIKKLKENHITAFPLSKCYIEGKPKTGLILGYAPVRNSILEKKVKRMGDII